MLKNDIPVETIQKVTDKSLEEIENLRKSL